MMPDGGRRKTHLLKVHVSTESAHATHAAHAAHTTHTAHTAHTTHATHAPHTAHAAHATHTTHIEVIIQGLIAVLLILINPLVKVGLDVCILRLILREAGPVVKFEIFFTKIEDEGA